MSNASMPCRTTTSIRASADTGAKSERPGSRRRAFRAPAIPPPQRATCCQSPSQECRHRAPPPSRSRRRARCDAEGESEHLCRRRAWQLAGLRLNTRTSSMSRTATSDSRTVRAMPPEPISPTRRQSGRAEAVACRCPPQRPRGMCCRCPSFEDRRSGSRPFAVLQDGVTRPAIGVRDACSISSASDQLPSGLHRAAKLG